MLELPWLNRSGRQILSLVVPEDLDFSGGGLVIRRGEIVDGCFSKKNIGRTPGNLLHQIFLDYSPHRCAEFITQLQKVVHAWLAENSFSTGIADCFPPAQEKREKVPDVQGTEAEINQVLNQVRDNTGNRIIASLPHEHGMRCMAAAGSKGSLLNVCQIMGLVGQQNIQGKRIPPWFKSERTLPCFPPRCTDPRSRGFVESSYLDGLKPVEFYTHAMAGREGIIDTAASGQGASGSVPCTVRRTCA